MRNLPGPDQDSITRDQLATLYAYLPDEYADLAASLDVSAPTDVNTDKFQTMEGVQSLTELTRLMLDRMEVDAVPTALYKELLLLYAFHPPVYEIIRTRIHALGIDLFPDGLDISTFREMHEKEARHAAQCQCAYTLGDNLGEQFFQGVSQGNASVVSQMDISAVGEIHALKRQVLATFGVIANDVDSRLLPLFFDCLQGDARSVRLFVENQCAAYAKRQEELLRKRESKVESLNSLSMQMLSSDSSITIGALGQPNLEIATEMRQNVFLHLRQFLGFFAEITQYVNSHSRDLFLTDGRDVLREILSIAARTSEEIRFGSKVNLYTILAKRIASAGEAANPWYKGNISTTPYSSRKIADLIDPDHHIPRRALGETLLHVNDYNRLAQVHEAMRIQADYYECFPQRHPIYDLDGNPIYIEGDHLREYDDSESLGVVVGLDDDGFGLEGEYDPSAHSRMTVDEYETFLAEEQRRRAWHDHAMDMLEHDLHARDGLPDDDEGSHDESFGDLLPEKSRHDEYGFWPRLRTLAGKVHTLHIDNLDTLEDAIEALNDWLDRNRLKRDKEQYSIEDKDQITVDQLSIRLLDPQKIVINSDMQQEFMTLIGRIKKGEEFASDMSVLGRSIQRLLQDYTPFLDMPLQAAEHKSIRRVLMELGQQYFTDKQILYGPQYDEELEEPTKGDPLFPMVDAELLDPTKKDNIRMNFNTAAVGINRGMHRNAARMFPQAVSNPFEDIALPALNREANEYFTAKDNYTFYAYENAATALREYISLCIRPRKKDNISCTDQEYVDIVQPIEHHKESVIRSAGAAPRCRSARTLAKAMCSQVDKNTRMFLVSSKTRLGDAPCSKKGEESNLKELKELIRLLRKDHKGIPIVLDVCQSLGRSHRESLQELNPDIILGNGSKGLGAGIGAFIGIRNDLAEQFDYKRTTSSVLTPLAMAFAMNMAHSTADCMRIEGNTGEHKKLPFNEKVRLHMVQLTKEAMRQIKEYGEYFGNVGFEDDFLEQSAGAFTCTLETPSHRNPNDYDGIVSFTLRNANMQQLHASLVDMGYQLTLEGETMRLSCHYLHDAKDIYDLFQTIKNFHRTQIRDDLEENRSSNHPLHN